MLQTAIKKIVITGAESSGKTTLAQQLATYCAVPLMPEYAREYLELLQRPYQQPDLLQIAKEHVRREDACIATATASYIFLDTDLLTIKIWSEYKYGNCAPWILQQIMQRKYDLYLLCSPDMPWQYDPLRENPHNRHEIFELYWRQLTQLNATFAVLSGDEEHRFQQAKRLIGV
ncbi:MAG: ATP-binding protein [Saprospiraceae bacterium]|nr:ATP-binding protein [Saprospiraceae bacterium]MBP7679609.1 ATP-binding protein [Saprospiraceae bacterium]